MQVVSHFFGIVTHGFDALGQHLGGGVSAHLESTRRIAAFVFKGFDQGSIFWLGGGVGRQGYQHAFDSIASDGVDLGVAHTFGAHHAHFQALLSGLAQQQTHFRVVATVVHKIGTGAFELGDHGRVVAVAGVDAFKQGHFDVGFFQLIAHRGGNALAIRLFVVQHGHFFGLGFVDDELGSRWPLLVIAANGAEDEVKILALGQCGRRGRGGNDHHAFVVVNRGGGDGSAGAHRADDVTNFVVHHPVGGHGALLGFASIIDHGGFDFFAIDAARRVDLLNSSGNAFFDHVAVLGQGAGGGNDHGDFDGVCGMRLTQQGSASQAHGGDQGLQTEGNMHGACPLFR